MTRVEIIPFTYQSIGHRGVSEDYDSWAWMGGKLLFASKEGRLLYHIDQALRRLYKTPESYGVCEECGTNVSEERLDALPHARLCIGCKEREESGVA